MVDADTFLGRETRPSFKNVLHGIYTWSSPIYSCTRNRMLYRIFVFADLNNAELEGRRQYKREQRSPSSIILWLQIEEIVSLVQTLCCVMELQLLFEHSPAFLNTFSICMEPSHFSTSFTHHWTLWEFPFNNLKCLQECFQQGKRLSPWVQHQANHFPWKVCTVSTSPCGFRPPKQTHTILSYKGSCKGIRKEKRTRCLPLSTFCFRIRHPFSAQITNKVILPAHWSALQYHSTVSRSEPNCPPSFLAQIL